MPGRPRYFPNTAPSVKSTPCWKLWPTPRLRLKVTLQPVKALGVDAAILFATSLPLVPMNIQLEFAAGEGPVIIGPIRSSADVDRFFARWNRANFSEQCLQAIPSVCQN